MSKSWDASDDRWFESLFGSDDPWPYPWAQDGLTYEQCTRCGIVMELPEKHLWSSTGREFCIDCNYPEFRAPFDGTINIRSTQTEMAGV